MRTKYSKTYIPETIYFLNFQSGGDTFDFTQLTLKYHFEFIHI